MMTPEQYARTTDAIKAEQAALAEARLRTLRRAVQIAQDPDNAEARAQAIAVEVLASGAVDLMLEAGLIAERLLGAPGAREAGDARRAILKAELSAQRIAVVGRAERKPVEHGKERTYIAGCRCADCVQAAAAARRVRKANAERAKREGGQRLDYALAI